jgi:hypothetical protein
LGFKSEPDVTFLFQSCRSAASPGGVLQERVKQGIKAIVGGGNPVLAGVSGLRNAEVFNRRGFQRNRLTRQNPGFYSNKSVAQKDLHRYFHRPETDAGRGVAEMVGMEPTLALGSGGRAIFPT